MLVAAHINMMGRLQAEEAQLSLNVAAASRYMKHGEWVRRLVTGIGRAAGGVRRKVAAAPSNLASVGIGSRKVKRG